jgi:malonyl CoA-acyl carrier protein transacylase
MVPFRHPVFLPENVRPSRLLLLAADDVNALKALVANAAENLEREASPFMARAYGSGAYRVAVIGGDEEKLRANLATAARHLERSDRKLRAPAGAYYGHVSDAPGEVALLFPGQGSQHAGMLAELCVAFPYVRAWFDGLDAAVADLTDGPLSALLFPPPDITDEQRRDVEATLLRMEGGAQLGFIAGLALHELLTHLGIRAGAMLGHSNGEHAALVASGMLVHESRAEIFNAAREGMLAARRLPPPVEPESSAAVSACPRAFLAELIAAMPNSLFLAMDNSPSQVVLSGRAFAIDRAIEQITTHGGICVRLPFPYAYHTPLFDGWRRTLDDAYRNAHAGTAHTRLYSCATAAPFPLDGDGARELAARQWTTVVRFGETIERLYADGFRTFVEAGPGNKLTSLVDDVLRKRPHVAVSACSSIRPELEQLHHLAADLFVAGYDIDPRRFSIESESQPVVSSSIIEGHFALMQEFLAGQDRVFSLLGDALEHAPFAHATHEHTKAAAAAAALQNVDIELGDQFGVRHTKAAAAAAALQNVDFELGDQFGVRRPQSPLLYAHATHERRFDVATTDSLLRDHSLGSALPVIPFTLSMELVAAAGRQLFGDATVVNQMTDLRASRWLALDEGTLRMRIVAEAKSPRSAHVQLFEIDTEERSVLAFEATIEVSDAFVPVTTPLSVTQRPSEWTASRFYTDYAFHGPAFQRIREVRAIGVDTAEALLEVGEAPMALDPAILDCAGQLVGLWLLERGHRDFGIFPYRLRAFHQHRPTPPAGARIHARATIRWDERGATDADVDFVDDHGALVYRLEGFEQRYFAFPPSYAALVLGGRSREERTVDARGLQRILGDLPEGFLEESWGIWNRALAHVVLDRDELRQWYSLPHRERAGDWLLARVLARETVPAPDPAAHAHTRQLGG